jgi:hypothetical protein
MGRSKNLPITLPYMFFIVPAPPTGSAYPNLMASRGKAGVKTAQRRLLVFYPLDDFLNGRLLSVHEDADTVYLG